MTTSTKKKILWYSDTPISTTGFGNVARNLIQRLGKEFDITVIGINSDGNSYDKTEFPCEIKPAFAFRPQNANGDVYGKDFLLEELQKGDFDYFFTLQDTFIIQAISERVKEIQEIKQKQGRPNFKWVLYYPTDMPLNPDWIIRSVMLSDVPVSYNEYGIKEVLEYSETIPELKTYRDRVKKIYHGSSDTDFHVVEKEKVSEWSKKFFNGKVKDDDFLIVNVNRNQSRKDIARTLMIFNLFQKQVPNAKLYTHCLLQKDKSSIDLLEVARRLGLDKSKSWIYPHPSLCTPGSGMPVGGLNMIYNRADVNMSTSLGEGWGLSCTEAMLTKTINLMPNNTSFPELLGEDRGYFMESGNTPSHFMVLGGFDNSIVRPLVDVEDGVKKLLEIKNNPDEVLRRTEKAYAWAKANLNWDKIAEQWKDEVFI